MQPIKSQTSSLTKLLTLTISHKFLAQATVDQDCPDIGTEDEVGRTRSRNNYRSALDLLNPLWSFQYIADTLSDKQGYNSEGLSGDI